MNMKLGFPEENPETTGLGEKLNIFDPFPLHCYCYASQWRSVPFDFEYNTNEMETSPFRHHLHSFSYYIQLQKYLRFPSSPNSLSSHFYFYGHNLSGFYSFETISSFIP